MPIGFSLSTGSLVLASSSAFAGSSTSTGFFIFSAFILDLTPIPTLPIGLIFSLFTSNALLIQDMTKPFHIRKTVTIMDNTNVKIHTKNTISIGDISFATLNQA